MQANRPESVVVRSRSPLYRLITEQKEQEDEKPNKVKALGVGRSGGNRPIRGASKD